MTADKNLFTRRGFLGGALAACGGSFTGCRLFTGAPADFDDRLTVFLSDIHVCGRDDFGRWRFTRRELSARVAEILAMDPLPRRVVCFGDLAFGSGEKCDYAQAVALMRPLSDAGIRVIHGMGNHDCRNHFLEFFPESAKTSPVDGRIVSEVDLGTCDLVLLDSLQGDAPDKGGACGGELNAAMQEYVRETLPKRMRPFLVGAHHPVYELKVGGQTLIRTLKESPKCVGWINGHNHNWMKEPLVSWGETNQDTIRALYLPSAGLWGDIGLVTLRTEAMCAVATLHQTDYWFNDELHAGERKPETWCAIVAENRGQYCVFPYERVWRTYSVRG